MKNTFHTLLLLASLIPLSVCALPCPNKMNGIIYKDDSMSEVESQCGKPISQNVTTKTIFLSQQWDYYVPSTNNTNLKMSLMFNNDQLVNIHIYDSHPNNCTNMAPLSPGSPSVAVGSNQPLTPVSNCQPNEYNTSSFSACGTILQRGMSTAFVQKACGYPQSQTNGESRTISVTKAVYQNQDGGTTTLTFEDDKLTDL